MKLLQPARMDECTGQAPIVAARCRIAKPALFRDKSAGTHEPLQASFIATGICIAAAAGNGGLRGENRVAQGSCMGGQGRGSNHQAALILSTGADSSPSEGILAPRVGGTAGGVRSRGLCGCGGVAARLWGPCWATESLLPKAAEVKGATSSRGSCSCPRGSGGWGPPPCHGCSLRGRSLAGGGKRVETGLRCGSSRTWCGGLLVLRCTCTNTNQTFRQQGQARRKAPCQSKQQAVWERGGGEGGK